MKLGCFITDIHVPGKRNKSEPFELQIETDPSPLDLCIMNTLSRRGGGNLKICCNERCNRGSLQFLCVMEIIKTTQNHFSLLSNRQFDENIVENYIV